MQVVMALQGDAKFLPELFQRLKAASPRDREWLDQVAFLQELCSLAKHLQAVSRTQLLSKLIKLGLFEVGRHLTAGSDRGALSPLALLCFSCYPAIQCRSLCKAFLLGSFPRSATLEPSRNLSQVCMGIASLEISSGAP